MAIPISAIDVLIPEQAVVRVRGGHLLGGHIQVDADAEDQNPMPDLRRTIVCGVHDLPSDTVLNGTSRLDQAREMDLESLFSSLDGRGPLEIARDPFKVVAESRTGDIPHILEQEAFRRGLTNRANGF